MTDIADLPATPAKRLIERFGAKRIAGWTRRHYSRVHAWSWPLAKGGTGGVIPHRVRRAIIAGAKSDLDEDLKFTDFEPADGESYDLGEGVAA